MGDEVPAVAAPEDPLELTEVEGAVAVEIEDPEPGAVAQQRIEIARLGAVVRRGALPVLEDDERPVLRDRLGRSFQDLPLRALDVDLDQCRHVAVRQRVVEAIEESGRLVPPENASALADAILELANDPARLRTLAEQAATHARRSFPYERMIEETARVYDRLVGP